MRGIVPAVHAAILHELQQPALAHDRVGQVQPRELHLVGPRAERQRVEHPVVERAMILELERAERVRDALDLIRERMRVVVHRIDAPRIARAVVRLAADPVQHRIAQRQVGRRHVDLRAQHARAVGKLPGAHAPEQVEVLLGRAVAIRALSPRLGERAAVLANLVRRRGRRRRPCRAGSAPPPTGRAARSNRTRRGCRRPTRTRASARPPGSNRRTRRLPWRGSCRPSAGCSGRRTPARCRSRGRWPWRGRCAGSRSARGKSRPDVRVPAGAEVVGDDRRG